MISQSSMAIEQGFLQLAVGNKITKDFPKAFFCGLDGPVQVRFCQRIVQEPAFKGGWRQVNAPAEHGMEVFFEKFIVGTAGAREILNGMQC